MLWNPDTLRKMWKTSEPQFLSSDGELQLFGVSMIVTSLGLMPHQHFYTEDFLKEYDPVFLPESATPLANLITSRKMLLSHLTFLMLITRSGSKEAKEFLEDSCGFPPPQDLILLALSQRQPKC